MSIISRLSARGTPRTEPAQATSGTRPTGPGSEPISEMERRLREQLSKHWQRTTMDRAMFAWWSLMASIKHLGGIHTMIPLEEWDFVEETVSLKGMVCWKCDFQTR